MKNIIPLIAIALAGCAYWYFTKGEAQKGEQTPEVVSELISGEPFKLSDLKGKTVYLVFWGSWCPPCKAELPHWVEFYNNKPNSDIEIVSIALEKKAGASKRFADKLNFPWKYQIEEESSYVALNGFARKYGVKDIPAAFKINSDGTLAEKVHHVPH